MSKTVLLQTNQFNVSTISMSKTVLFQTIQFNVSTISMSKTRKVCNDNNDILHPRDDTGILYVTRKGARVGVGLGWVLWHINHCGLYNASFISNSSG